MTGPQQHAMRIADTQPPSDWSHSRKDWLTGDRFQGCKRITRGVAPNEGYDT